MSATPRLRFAPSPNGFLHLGHAYSALMNARLAARLGGTLLLRFENIDPVRCRPDYITEALADLGWLGIPWQPPPLLQSTRLPAYAEALARLGAAGLLYPCFCSRGDIARTVASRPDWPRDPDGAPLYPGTCRHLSAAERDARIAAAEKPAWRLDMAKALQHCPPDLAWCEYRESDHAKLVPAEPAQWGDALLARKDVPTSYHLAVVVDDAAQGITDVVRGEDLFAATGLHRLLQLLLGFGRPAYHHHRLIRDLDGEKLAKSRGAAGLRERRLAGETSAALLRTWDGEIGA